MILLTEESDRSRPSASNLWRLEIERQSIIMYYHLIILGLKTKIFTQLAMLETKKTR